MQSGRPTTTILQYTRGGWPYMFAEMVHAGHRQPAHSCRCKEEGEDNGKPYVTTSQLQAGAADDLTGSTTHHTGPV